MESKSFRYSVFLFVVLVSVSAVKTTCQKSSQQNKKRFAAAIKTVKGHWFASGKGYYHLFQEKSLLRFKSLSPCGDSPSDNLCKKQIGTFSKDQPNRLKSVSPYEFCVDFNRNR